MFDDMGKHLYQLAIFFIISLVSAAQDKVSEIEMQENFSKGGMVAGYYNNHSQNLIINFQKNREIYRHLYDSQYHLKKQYVSYTRSVLLNSGQYDIPVYVSDLTLRENNYEIYANRRNVTLIKPDFDQQKDHLLFELTISSFENEERRLAIIPFSKGLRVLCYAPKKEKLIIYQWSEPGITDTLFFDLPESSLTEEEIKKYTKVYGVKYKSTLGPLIAAPVDSSSVVMPPGNSYAYYTDEKVHILCLMPYFSGYHMLSLDIQERTLSSWNLFLNEMRHNVDASNNYAKVIPYAVMTDERLIVRNSSAYQFEYLIYDLKTKEKIRSYKAAPDKSLKKLLHSDFVEEGFGLTAEEGKNLDTEKAFLRKLSAGAGFLVISNSDKDSITLTTGSFKRQIGPEGILLSLGTGFLGYMANLTVSNIQIIPFLSTHRIRLLYTHTRFSKNDWEVSVNQKIVLPVDRLLNEFKQRDILAKSSFLYRVNHQYFAAVFVNNSNKFEVFSLITE